MSSKPKDIHDIAAALKSIKLPHLPGLHLDRPLEEALDMMALDACRRAEFEMTRNAMAWLQEQGWATPERARALSEAAVTLQREVDRLRLALAEEIAGRIDRALSPNNAAGPGVYVCRVITAEELGERVMAGANRKVGFGPWAEDKL